MRALTIVGDRLVVAERHVDEPVADQLRDPAATSLG
jgi:hypothetical protein